MSEADRQRRRRQQLKDSGHVDIRLDIPKDLKERIRLTAKNNKLSMKDEIISTLESVYNG